MSCDIGEVTDRLENKLCYDYNYELCSFSKAFHHFTYVTAHSSTLPLLHLRHSSFSNHSFASPTSQALHLRHLANRPCISTLVTRFSQNIEAYTDKNKALIDCHKCSSSFFTLPNPTLLKSLPVSCKRSDQIAVSSYSS